MSETRVKIYVQLLEEGTPTARPTEALALGDGVYKILQPDDYDPDDEMWEFPPGSLVRCELMKEGWAKELFLAVKIAKL